MRIRLAQSPARVHLFKRTKSTSLFKKGRIRYLESDSSMTNLSLVNFNQRPLCFDFSSNPLAKAITMKEMFSRNPLYGPYSSFIRPWLQSNQSQFEFHSSIFRISNRKRKFQ